MGGNFYPKQGRKSMTYPAFEPLSCRSTGERPDAILTSRPLRFIRLRFQEQCLDRLKVRKKRTFLIWGLNDFALLLKARVNTNITN